MRVEIDAKFVMESSRSSRAAAGGQAQILIRMHYCCGKIAVKGFEAVVVAVPRKMYGLLELTHGQRKHFIVRCCVTVLDAVSDTVSLTQCLTQRLTL